MDVYNIQDENGVVKWLAEEADKGGRLRQLNEGGVILKFTNGIGEENQLTNLLMWVGGNFPKAFS